MSMSIQWTIAAWFLYAEIFLVTLLVLPIFSATKWKKIFNSSILRYIGEKANFLFVFFIFIVSIFLIDAIREIVKYKQPDINLKKNMSDIAAREFRAQRNLYITGISLFLCFVIKRLVVLISTTADLAMEKRTIEIEKITIQKELLVLTERSKSDQEETLNQLERSLLPEQSGGNKAVNRREEENEESNQTRSRSQSRTNLLNKKDE